MPEEPEVPKATDIDELWKATLALHEELLSMATERDIVFFTKEEIERLYSHGKEAIELLSEAGLLTLEFVFGHTQSWRITKVLDLNKIQSTILSLTNRSENTHTNST